MSASMLNNNSSENRYELVNDGVLVAIAAYKLADGVITFTHTEVIPQHEGEGNASELARRALEDASKLGLRIVPACSFIAGFIGKHPEYEKLVSR